MPAERFAEECLSPRDGTVFQEVLKPHPEIAAAISPAVVHAAIDCRPRA